MSTNRREQFKKMIKDCEDGKIDMVITKSISRFARNTQDCLQYSRKLKTWGLAYFLRKRRGGRAALYHHEFTGVGGEPLHLGELQVGDTHQVQAGSDVLKCKPLLRL